MKKKKLVSGQVLEVANLDNIDPYERENLDFIVGTRVTYTGNTTELIVYDDAYDTDGQRFEVGYEVEFNIDDTETATVYLLWDNFDVIDKKKLDAPATEVEWLDRVQANFRM